MKKTIALLLVVVMVLGVMFSAVGCSKQQEQAAEQQQKEEQKEEPKTTLDIIKERGKLIIGTSADYPPYEFYDENKNVVGFDIDVAKKIAEKMGVELEIKDMSFDGIIPALLSKQIDFAIAGFTITEERKKSVDFVPYLDASLTGSETGQILIANKKGSVKSVEDLNGKVVAVQLGTTGEEEAKNLAEKYDIEIKGFSKVVPEIILELKNMSSDAAVVGLNTAKEIVKEHDDIMIVGDILNSEEEGIPVRKEDKELYDFIKGVIEELKASGEYQKMIDKWFKEENK